MFYTDNSTKIRDTHDHLLLMPQVEVTHIKFESSNSRFLLKDVMDQKNIFHNDRTKIECMGMEVNFVKNMFVANKYD